MTRIALLGNSHLANWRVGWEAIKGDYPRFDLTFFAAPGERLACCQPRTDRLNFEDKEVADLVEMTSGGKRNIVVADYDAFCIVGLEFGISRSAVKLYMGWRADSHRSQAGRFRLISDECFLDAVRDVLNASLAMDLSRKLRSISDKPVVVGTQPAPSEGVLKMSAEYRGIRWATEGGDSETLRATYDEACRGLEKDGVRILDQPTTTLASPLLSKELYERRRPSADLTHTNGAFGELAVRDLLTSPLLARHSRQGEAGTEGEEVTQPGNESRSQHRESIFDLTARTLGRRLQLLRNRKKALQE